MPKRKTPPTFRTGAEAVAWAKEERRKIVKRKLERAGDLIAEANFLLKMDYPDGGIFIEGEGTINALSTLDESARQHGIVVSVHLPKGTFDCGAW